MELDDESILLDMQTIRSGIHIAMAARTRAFEGADQLSPTRSLLVDEMGWVAHELEVSATVGCSIRIEKVMVVHTSRDRVIASPAEAAQTLLGRTPGADALLAAHERAWQILWDEFRITMDSGARQSRALNLNTFHILQTLASVTADLDAGIPAVACTVGMSFGTNCSSIPCSPCGAPTSAGRCSATDTVAWAGRRLRPAARVSPA